MSKVSGNQLKKLQNIVSAFRLLDQVMPIQTVAAFLFVANNDEKGKRTTMTDIAKHLDFQAATITRNVSNLSDWTYQKEKGLGLVKMEYDPQDQRVKLVTLTGKGRSFVQTLKEKLDGNS